MSHTFGSNISYGGPDTYAGYGQYGARRTLPAALAARMGKPSAKLQLLLTIQVGRRLTDIAGAAEGAGAEATHWLYEFESTTKPIAVRRNNGNVSLDETTLATIGDVDHEWAWGGPSGLMSGNDRGLMLALWEPITVFNHTFQAIYEFKFSKNATSIRDDYWEPRVKSVPNLSLRIEARFSGVGQIGGGKITLDNSDGFFDDLDTDEYQWDAGTATLEFGIDLPNSELDEDDYQKIGTWRIESVQRTDTEFILNVKELKTKLESKVPYELYTREEYPAMPNEWIGRPIPYAYGRLFSKEPAPVNPALRKFKVAAHAIRSFDGVRVKNNNDTWEEVNFATVNTSLAEFTLAGADWTGDEPVAVDFSGRMNPDGSLMENDADIVADFLNYVGETNLDEASFHASAKSLHVGRDRFGNAVTKFAASMYINEETTGLEVISEINRIASSFLFVDFQGRWRFGVFDPVQAKALDPMAGALIRKFTQKEIIEGTWRKTVESEEVFSKVKVIFARRDQEEWFEFVEHEREDHQLLHDISELFPQDREIGLSKRSDALHWAQRLLTTEAEPLTTFSFSVPWVAFFLLPGDKIHVTHERHNLNAVLEILSVNYDLVNGRVAFECGNLRGWGDTHGFWVHDIASVEEPGPPVFPPGAIFIGDGATVFAGDGQPISDWWDQSAFGNHATQPLPAHQPTLKANAINGHSAIKFLGDITTGQEPLAYWKMDNTTSQQTDSTTGGRHLTYVPNAGSAAFGVPGLIDKCLAIQNSAGYGLADDAAMKLTATSFTFRFWIRLSTVSGNKQVFVKYNSVASGYSIDVLTGTLWFSIFNGAANQISSTTTMVANTWYHCVCTFDDATDTMKLYVNGVLEATLAAVGNVVGNSLSVRIAGTSVTVSNVNYDEMGIWQTVWSLAEVQSDFNGGVGRTYPNSLAQYLNFPNVLWDNLEEGEIFAVVKADNDPGSFTGGNSTLWVLGNGVGEKYPSADGLIYEQFGTTIPKATSDPVPSLAGWRLYNVTSKPNEYKVRLDTTEILSTLVNTVDWHNAPTFGAGGTTWFNGQIAEIIIYPRVLTATERADLVQILSTKYALGLSFPGTSGENVIPAPDWDPDWTDEQVTHARQNNGFWSWSWDDDETQMAMMNKNDIAEQDNRSFRPSRWW